MPVKEMAKVLKGYRVTLPERVRNAANVKEGDMVIIEGETDKVTILPVDVRPRRFLAA